VSAFFQHPVDALHGDFGKVKHLDIIIVISRSGNTQEVVDFISRCRVIKLCKVILITAKPGSKLSCFATHTICTNQSEEIGGLIKLAPNVSTICAMIVGDILAINIAEELECTEQQYRTNHPNGIVE
jgi:arabinose-5-phosphate isomerase